MSPRPQYTAIRKISCHSTPTAWSHYRAGRAVHPSRRVLRDDGRGQLEKRRWMVMAGGTETYETRFPVDVFSSYDAEDIESRLLLCNADM